MGRNGEGEGGAAAAVGVGGMSECCMCGDYGLSSHLFICKLCRFRSQHKYCSNLYPEAESYHICNWCLSQNADKKGELQANTKATSPNSSSSSLKTPSDHMKISTRKRVLGGNNHGGLKDASDHIKKQKKSSSAGRKRVTTDHGGSNIGKKTRSEEVPNGGVKVFRNKVRRYKLLDEVPS